MQLTVATVLVSFPDPTCTHMLGLGTRRDCLCTWSWTMLAYSFPCGTRKHLTSLYNLPMCCILFTMPWSHTLCRETVITFPGCWSRSAIYYPCTVCDCDFPVGLCVRYPLFDPVHAVELLLWSKPHMYMYIHTYMYTHVYTYVACSGGQVQTLLHDTVISPQLP